MALSGPRPDTELVLCVIPQGGSDLPADKGADAVFWTWLYKYLTCRF